MRRRRIIWLHVLTVLSAAVLIGAEVFGAAWAGGWALGHLFDLGDYATYALEGIFSVAAFAVTAAFIRRATETEPFLTGDDEGEPSADAPSAPPPQSG